MRSPGLVVGGLATMGAGAAFVVAGAATRASSSPDVAGCRGDTGYLSSFCLYGTASSGAAEGLSTLAMVSGAMIAIGGLVMVVVGAYQVPEKRAVVGASPSGLVLRF